MMYPSKRKKYESKTVLNPNIKHIILAIDLLIIIGMFIYAKQYFNKPKRHFYTFENIEYFLQAELLSNKVDYLLELRMKNKEKEPNLLKFTEPQYNFIIKKHGRVVWHISGTNQKEALLQPKEELYFSQVWNKRNKLGETVKSGEYQLICRINLTPPINIDTYIKLK
ncbi:MAG: BsuPI-related putative proteinase inhibitor [bacterium]|nr:BsuPI-related putative proteinase inhibitor [bacterium]